MNKLVTLSQVSMVTSMRIHTFSKFQQIYLKAREGKLSILAVKLRVRVRGLAIVWTGVIARYHARVKTVHCKEK